MSEINDLVNELIRTYRAQHQITEHPRVVHIPHASSGRTGAYDLAEVHEDASALLHQLSRLAKDGVERREERVELEHPQQVILARKAPKGAFTLYLNGFRKRDQSAVWGYSSELAMRVDFSTAEKTAIALGPEVFALPVNERRMRSRTKTF